MVSFSRDQNQALKPFFKLLRILGNKSQASFSEFGKKPQFPSALEVKDEKINNFINEEIKKQHKAGITSRAIARRQTTIPREVIIQSKKLGIVWRSAEVDWRLPAQIIIYSDRVLLTSFVTQIISTLIINKDIADSLK